MARTMRIFGAGLTVAAAGLFSVYALAEDKNRGSGHDRMTHDHMQQGRGPMMDQGMMMRRGMMGRGMMGHGMHMGMMNMDIQIPANNPITPEKVKLGKQLFFDSRLSRDKTISCNSCHDLSKAGADEGAVSTGVGGAQGERNSPTVWDAARHNAQFWDGRASSLEEQAKGPLINPVEMAMLDLDAVVQRVKDIDGYVSQFDKVFGKDSVNIDNIAKAIATYERTLISSNSKFDDYRFNGKATLSDDELKGFQTFVEVGCMQCHMGPDLSGHPPLARFDGFYQEFPQFTNNSYVAKYKLLADNGRYEATKQEDDRHVYRVTSLRNVAKTAPYFHNGSVDSLDEAVRVCGEVTNERKLKDDEVKSIVAFLGTLNGKFTEQKAPKLPE